MTSSTVLRILDASLNRAEEGLRVVEDFVRFVLDDPFLTGETKSLRHELQAAAAGISAADRHAARDSLQDVGLETDQPSERRREDVWNVCAASFKRAQQSLRSLEEYGKLIDAEFATRCEALRYRLYALEKAVDVGRTSRERLEGVRLCVLVDGGPTEAEFGKLVESLVEAGVGMIQLRDKRLDDRALAARARLLVGLTRAPHPKRSQPPALPVDDKSLHSPTETEPPAEPGAEGDHRGRSLAIVNDRPDIAAAVHADGVHIGQEDLSAKDVRAVVSPRMLIGVSTHSMEQARAAVLDGANYLGAGPTFPSRTKDFSKFAGLDYLRSVAVEIRLPTFAIGGINAENLPEVVATGTSRVAVGAAVTGANQPGSAAQALLTMLNGLEG